MADPRRRPLPPRRLSPAPAHGATCRWPSRSAGCTRSRAWPPSSRPGRGPRAARRCNLLVVGGDLEDPTDDEAAELAGIDAAVPSAEAARRACSSPATAPTPSSPVDGRRPAGPPRARRPRPGVYVSASLKEEFGIAILEAMASGLVVVAPAGAGRPPTSRTGSPGCSSTPPRRGPRRGVRGALTWRATPRPPPRRRARASCASGSASTRWRPRSTRSTAVATAAPGRGARGRPPEPGRGEPAVTLLVVSPDYASHLYPSATLATAWQEPGSGWSSPPGRPPTASSRLRLRPRRPPARSGLEPRRHPGRGPARGEDDALRGLLRRDPAGRRRDPRLPGPGPRRTDLLWDPVGTARRRAARRRPRRSRTTSSSTTSPSAPGSP